MQMTGPPVVETAAKTRRRTESSKSATHPGWDQPPAVASPTLNESWTPRPCHWRTPQRLFVLDPQQQQLAKDFSWGNLLCSPIVVSKRYILVALDTQLLLYGNFDGQPQLGTKSIAPFTNFSLDATDDGTSFGDDKILQITFYEETSIVYAVTVEACVYQVKLVLDDNNGTTPTFQMMHSWITRQLGVTCMATHSNHPESGFDTICVGYRSGHIEAWKVPQVFKEDPKRKTRMPPRKSSRDVILEWDGFLYNSVRTLSFLPSGKEDDELLLMAVVSIVTLDKGAEQPTSSMLKILDLKQMKSEKQKQETTTTAFTGESSLSLEHYSLAPPRGMELVDASTLSLSKDPCLPKRVPVLDGQRANGACNFSVGTTNISSIAFSDGTIGLFSRNNDSLGIAEANHQVLLSYPAIGSGHVLLADDENDKNSCLAVCLRGGTCYLIPVSIADSNNNEHSIVAIPFPHDIEMDLSDVYVQAFTAGNLTMDGIDRPVLIYAWPGGVMDIYSCGLVADSKVSLPKPDEIFVSRAQKRCLRDLIDGQAISLVTQILEESRDNNPLLQTSEWKELLEEYKAGRIPLGQDIPLESLLSKEYQSLRNVLLSLALVKE